MLKYILECKNIPITILLDFYISRQNSEQKHRNKRLIKYNYFLISSNKM